MDSLVLVKNSTALLPRQHLAHITSLEFIWDIGRWKGDCLYEIEHFRRWKTYRELMLAITTSTYPSLKKLFIVVHNLSDYIPSIPPGNLMRASTDENLAVTLLGSPDRIAKEYGSQLQKFIVTYVSHMFHRLATTVDHLGIEDADSEMDEDGRFFRHLPTDEETEVSNKVAGYWVHGSNGFSHYRDKGFL